jgi:hypothetical protein
MSARALTTSARENFLQYQSDANCDEQCKNPKIGVSTCAECSSTRTLRKCYHSNRFLYKPQPSVERRDASNACQREATIYPRRIISVTRSSIMTVLARPSSAFARRGIPEHRAPRAGTDHALPPAQMSKSLTNQLKHKTGTSNQAQGGIKTSAQEGIVSASPHWRRLPAMTAMLAAAERLELYRP